MEILGYSIGQESRQVLGEIMMIHNGLIHVPWSNYMRLRLINCVWLSHHAWGEQHLFLDALVGLPSRIHCRYSEKGHWAKRRFLFVRWWSRQIRKTSEFNRLEPIPSIQFQCSTGNQSDSGHSVAALFM